MKLNIFIAVVVLSILVMEGCGFLGIFGGGSNANEPSMLKGKVKFSDDDQPLLDGLVRVNFNGVEVSKNIAIREGEFKVPGLTSGCCYVVIFEDPKSGVRLGLDTNITLGGGETKKDFVVSKPGPDYMNLPPDTTQNKDINLPPKP